MPGNLAALAAREHSGNIVKPIGELQSCHEGEMPWPASDEIDTGMTRRLTANVLMLTRFLLVGAIDISEN